MTITLGKTTGGCSKTACIGMEFIILLALGTFLSFAWLDHNDFMYYGAAVIKGRLYHDIYFSQVPLSFYINRALAWICPDQFDYLFLRLASVAAFAAAIMLIGHHRLQKKSFRILFYCFCLSTAGSISWEIGNYAYTFLLFCISLVCFEKSRNSRDYFLAGLFLGLAISTKLTYAPTFLAFSLLLLCRDTNRFTAFASAFAGGVLGLAPILYFAATDFPVFKFFITDFHLLTRQMQGMTLTTSLHNIASNTINIYDFFFVMPVYYIYSRSKLLSVKPELHKTGYEILMLAMLFVSAIMPFYITPQYIAPLTMFAFLFSLGEIEKHEHFIPLKTASFVGVFILVLAAISLSAMFAKRSIKYYKNEGAFHVQKVENEVSDIVRNKLSCAPVVRSFSSAFLPSYGLTQHRHNVGGPFITRLRDALPADYYKGPAPILDEGILFIEKEKDFNAVFTGHYTDKKYEQDAEKYALARKWKLFKIDNQYNFYVARDCVK